MVVFFVLLAALAVAGIVATIVNLSYTGPQRIPTRHNGTR
jgi:hypothetical protein